MQLLELVYSELLGYYSRTGLLPPDCSANARCVVYHSAEPSLFVMKNGLLVISSCLLDHCLDAGVDTLAYAVCHELSHLAQNHLLTNLSKLVPYGDMRR